MLGGIISLASYGLSTGGTAGNILFQLEQQGVFAYILPFLMIFAVLFGILSKIRIFGDNKGINIILSLAVALMSLQLNFVSYFFREIFPRMGIMLAIILVVMILLGLFFNVKKSKLVKTIMGIIMTIGVLVIIIQSFAESGLWFSGIGSSWMLTYYLERYATGIIVFILVVGGFLAVILGGNKTKGMSPEQRYKYRLKEMEIGAARKVDYLKDLNADDYD